MAFHPKSKAAMGLPTRRNQALSDHLDMGMKCFLRQTPFNNATMVLRQSVSKYNQQPEKLNNNKVHMKTDIKNSKNNGSLINNVHSERRVSSEHHTVCQTAADAFPILVPAKSSQIGRNTYQDFVQGLSCDVRKREVYFKSVIREEEKRRLKILNSVQTPRSKRGNLVYAKATYENYT